MVSPFLQIVEHLDGTITRPTFPTSPPSPGGDDHEAVLSKDVSVNVAHNTWLRLYLPATAVRDQEKNRNLKLPIIVYFHGGGFVLFSAASEVYHRFCNRLSAALPAVVVSVDYRLAPEHRLPAAYDDAVDALNWIGTHSSTDPWLAAHGDFSRCFLMGHSSGANIVLHAVLREIPIKVSGLIVNQPFFGGETRTPSEIESGEDPVIPLLANDHLWRLALPVGADRDHPFCNPSAAAIKANAWRLPKCLVKGYKGDPLYDRQKVFAGILDAGGVRVVEKLESHGFHAVELFVPEQAQELVDEVKQFVNA